jgi:hypothetical protein
MVEISRKWKQFALSFRDRGFPPETIAAECGVTVEEVELYFRRVGPGMTVLKPDEVDRIRKSFEAGVSMTDLSRKYKISKERVKGCLDLPLNRTPDRVLHNPRRPAKTARAPGPLAGEARPDVMAAARRLTAGEISRAEFSLLLGDLYGAARR